MRIPEEVHNIIAYGDPYPSSELMAQAEHYNNTLMLYGEKEEQAPEPALLEKQNLKELEFAEDGMPY